MRAKRHSGKAKIFISDGEHASVEAPARLLESEGYTVLRVPTRGGRLDLDFIRENADDSVILSAIMLVNNETGAVYDVKSAADIVRAASPKAFIHCDAVQAFMKIPVLPKRLGVDSVAVSSHKVFAPKGAGALYVSAEALRAKRLVPVIYGGASGLFPAQVLQLEARVGSAHYAVSRGLALHHFSREHSRTNLSEPIRNSCRGSST